MANRVTDLAAQLEHELEAARSEVAALQQKNAQLDEEIAAAETREREVLVRAAKAEEKRQNAEGLLSASYKDVVQELFEEPSRRAARLTVTWATVSIIVGLGATLWSSLYSAHVGSQATSRLSNSIDERLAWRLKNTQAAITAGFQKSEQHVSRIMQQVTPVSLSTAPQSTIRLQNDCNKPASVAIRFVNAQAKWETTGWFVVQPHSQFDPHVVSFGGPIFFFAKSSDGSTWRAWGAENEISVKATVDKTNAFTILDTSTTVANPELVSFFGRTPFASSYTQSFSCN